MNRKSLLHLIVLLAILGPTLLATACSAEPVPPASPGGTDGATSTPVPEAEPDPIEVLINDFVNDRELASQSFLGLTLEDWLNLGFSVLFVVVGSLLLIPLLLGLLDWLARRTKTHFDDAFLDAIRRELKWLVVIVLARLAVLRLDFWGPWLRFRLEDIFFFLLLGVQYIISLRLIGFTASWYREHQVPEASRERLDPFINALKTVGFLSMTITALNVALSHYGYDVALPTAALLFFFAVLSLSARSAIADAVDGAFILLNEPFRVGHDIRIEELDTWGEVVEIGVRNTHIRTLENREVIIPNSLIGESQLVNFSDPDPTLRVETDVGVAYGADIDRAERVIEAAVRSVEGVLDDKPVEVWFLSYGDFARNIRVLWWIDDVSRELPIRNHVNRAIEVALAEARIDCPFPTYNLNLSPEAGNSSRAAQAPPSGDLRASQGVESE